MKKANLDEQIYGPEPELEPGCVDGDIVKAFNWYNYYFTSDDAKRFVIEYHQQNDPEKVAALKQLRAYDLMTIGWVCRILSQGGSLPDSLKQRQFDKLDVLVANYKPPEEEAPKPDNKLSEVLGHIEEIIDGFPADPTEAVKALGIKPVLASKVVAYYVPIMNELEQAMLGNDDELKEAYGNHDLKKLLGFYQNIALALIDPAVKKERKPIKKKPKPAAAQVSKIKYLAEDPNLKITSVPPASIIGAQQLWVFNSKVRVLSVYNAKDETGLGMKGTTLLNFNEENSISKKIRKPDVVTREVLDANKVALRKIMENINCKESRATGRINTDTLLLRTIK